MTPGLCIICGFVGVCLGLIFWEFTKLLSYIIETNKRVKIKTRNTLKL